MHVLNGRPVCLGVGNFEPIGGCSGESYYFLAHIVAAAFRALGGVPLHFDLDQSALEDTGDGGQGDLPGPVGAQADLASESR